MRKAKTSTCSGCLGASFGDCDRCRNTEKNKEGHKMIHLLKLREDFAPAIEAGIKPFEIRYNDRGYQKGDQIIFHTIDKDGQRTPSSIEKKTFEVTYVLSGWGLKEDYVALGIKEIKEEK